MAGEPARGLGASGAGLVGSDEGRAQRSAGSLPALGVKLQAHGSDRAAADSRPVHERSSRPRPLAGNQEPGKTRAVYSEDLRLVRATINVDREAIAVFVDRLRCVARYLAACNRRFGHMLTDSDLCDLIQDVMTLLWIKRPTYLGAGSLEAWACGTALLQFYNRLRRRGRERARRIGDYSLDALATPTDPDPLEQMEVREALARLPERERSVIWAKHYQSWSFSEIGTSLGMSPNTAKSCYYRGLERLRDKFLAPLREMERQ